MSAEPTTPRPTTARTVLVLLLAAIGLTAVVLIREPLPEPDTTVTLAEYVIGAPTQLAPGEHVFLVRNQGHAHHNLTVCPLDEASGKCAGPPEYFDMLRRPEDARDQSFYKDRADMLVLGKRWDTLIRYDLDPGTYRFYCGIIGHAQNGMQLTVEVG